MGGGGRGRRGWEEVRVGGCPGGGEVLGGVLVGGG